MNASQGQVEGLGQVVHIVMTVIRKINIHKLTIDVPFSIYFLLKKAMYSDGYWYWHKVFLTQDLDCNMFPLVYMIIYKLW